MGDFSSVGDGGDACSSSGGSAVSTDGVGGRGVGAEITDWCSQGAATAAGGGASEPEASVAAALR